MAEAVSERGEQPDVRATASDAEEARALRAREGDDGAQRRPERERGRERRPERRPEPAGVAADRPPAPGPAPAPHAVQPPAPAPHAVQPPAPAPHSARFQVFTGVLIAVALAAVTVAVLVASGGGRSGENMTTWSPFKPSSDGLDTGAREIADYVGGRYRLPGGQQIVAVTGGPLELQGLPMRIAVRHAPADGGRIDVLDGRGVLYRLCGLGPKCAISSGKATPERGLLLQREALELALYSFHDLSDVAHVVVFMPPPKGKSAQLALHFRRGDVAGQLARPLRTTLPALVPTPDTIDQSPEKRFVESLTFGNVFKFSLTEANQDASVFLVLDPVPAQS